MKVTAICEKRRWMMNYQWSGFICLLLDWIFISASENSYFTNKRWFVKIENKIYDEYKGIPIILKNSIYICEKKCIMWINNDLLNNCDDLLSNCDGFIKLSGWERNKTQW